MPRLCRKTGRAPCFAAERIVGIGRQIDAVDAGLQGQRRSGQDGLARRDRLASGARRHSPSHRPLPVVRVRQSTRPAAAGYERSRGCRIRHAADARERILVVRDSVTPLRCCRRCSSSESRRCATPRSAATDPRVEIDRTLLAVRLVDDRSATGWRCAQPPVGERLRRSRNGRRLAANRVVNERSISCLRDAGNLDRRPGRKPFSSLTATATAGMMRVSVNSTSRTPSSNSAAVTAIEPNTPRRSSRTTSRSAVALWYGCPGVDASWARTTDSLMWSSPETRTSRIILPSSEGWAASGAAAKNTASTSAAFFIAPSSEWENEVERRPLQRHGLASLESAAASGLCSFGTRAAPPGPRRNCIAAPARDR